MKVPLALVLAAAASIVHGVAQAQAVGPVRNRPEVAIAGGWIGGAALGDSDATLRSREGANSRLFSTSSRFAGAPVIELRVGVPLTRRYAVEGRVGFSHPQMRTAVTADVEGAPAIILAERVDQYLFEGAVIAMLDGLSFQGLVPFASGGAGYLRQLHEGQTLIEEGVAYHAGGGLRRTLFTRPRGWLKGAGLRGDVRLYVLAGGVNLDAGARAHASASASVYLAF